MTRPAPFAVVLAVALSLAGCGKREQGNILAVSVIGGPATLRTPGGSAPSGASAALLGAAAQGLVRFDENAQVEPGVAMRWAISDDGLYYTFRLDRDLADADRVASRLRRLLRRYRDQSPDAAPDAIREIVAVTPEVIEIRLSAPRPELMLLLAEPAFALLIDGRGTGPLLAEGRAGGAIELRPKPLLNQDEADERTRAAAKRRIFLRGERASLAVARFAQGQANLVTGGTFNDMLYTKLANIAPNSVQIDPATGLFGLRVVRRASPLAAVELRQALDMALDRDALGVQLGVGGWRPSQAILPPGLTDIVQPTRPFWARAFANVRGSDRLALAERVATARRIVARWCGQHHCKAPVRISLAMPDGPGADILFAVLRRQWRAIGIEAVRAGPRDAADLRLIDEVAPAGQADWFLAHFLCARGSPCSEEADSAFGKARAAIDPAERARLIGEAEQRIMALAPYIPIAQPVRWSLASPDLPGFRQNSRAFHPLIGLIGNQSVP